MVIYFTRLGQVPNWIGVGANESMAGVKFC
jgi:hypothetical protein